MDRREHVYCADRACWREWLSDNFEKKEAIWLIYDKGQKGEGALNYNSIVEEALCFGWIDSRPGKIDHIQTKLYMSRRKPNSMWSKLNKSRVEELRAAKLMTMAGERAISIAKANGSWDILNDSDNLVIAADLAAAFAAADPIAQRNFSAFSDSSQRNILYWIYSAKRPPTRAQRITIAVEKAAKNERAR